METRRLVGLVGLLVLVAAIGTLVAGALAPGMAWGMGPGMMWGWREGVPGGGWGLGLAMAIWMLAMFAFWTALLVGAILLVRWVFEALGEPRGPAPDDPLTILRRRYAAGEIDEATYERMKRELAA